MTASKLNRIMTKGARQPHRAYPAKSDRPLRILDKTRVLLPAPEAPLWLVLMVAPRREVDAVKALHEAGYSAWQPQVTLWLTSARDRIKTKVNRPLFPRYVFCAQKPGASKSITDVDHVSCIIGMVPKPKKDQPGLLDVLSSKQEKGEYDVTRTPPLPFDDLDTVEVTDGPFYGLRGIVNRSDHERALVLLQILGHDTPVDISVDDLRKVA